MRLVDSYVGQQVGDEGAGHDDSLSLVGDEGGEVPLWSAQALSGAALRVRAGRRFPTRPGARARHRRRSGGGRRRASRHPLPRSPPHFPEPSRPIPPAGWRGSPPTRNQDEHALSPATSALSHPAPPSRPAPARDWAKAAASGTPSLAVSRRCHMAPEGPRGPPSRRPAAHAPTALENGTASRGGRCAVPAHTHWRVRSCRPGWPARRTGPCARCRPSSSRTAHQVPRAVPEC